jgi:hypothetical protein
MILLPFEDLLIDGDEQWETGGCIEAGLVVERM